MIKKVLTNISRAKANSYLSRHLPLVNLATRHFSISVKDRIRMERSSRLSKRDEILPLQTIEGIFENNKKKVQKFAILGLLHILTLEKQQ